MSRLDLIQASPIEGTEYDLRIYQGKTYTLNFDYSEDVSAGTLRGQVRNTYREESGTLEASFSFTASWDGSNTAISATISATNTTAMNATTYQGVGTPNKNNAHVYDIEHDDGLGIVTPILHGFVQVFPEVIE